MAQILQQDQSYYSIILFVLKPEQVQQQLLMIEEDIAKDNLRSCSQHTYYLFQWTESANNPPATLQSKQILKPSTKTSSQFTSQYLSLKDIQSKKYSVQLSSQKDIAQQQPRKISKELKKQRPKEVLCRFEYPVLDSTQFTNQQNNFWSKLNRKDVVRSKKLESLNKQRSRKSLTNLAQHQAKKLKTMNPKEKISKLFQFKLRHHVMVPTNALPALANKKFKATSKQEDHGYRPILIDNFQAEESASQKRNSMPIVRQRCMLEQL